MPPVMGSRSTYLRAGIGGFQGRALMPGDEIPLGEFESLSASDLLIRGAAQRKLHLKKVPEVLIPEYKHEQTIRIISGPEAHYFEIAGLRTFLLTEYTVTAQSDRMGYRLSGEPIRHKEGLTNIISAGISLGTVQIPGDGQPIILMADRQTSGGYIRLANVISVDLTLLPQMRPGDRIRFKETTLDMAQQVCVSKQQSLFNLCLTK